MLRELEVREVAPCFDCGHDPHEPDQLANGEVDFASYDPAYFGRPQGAKRGPFEFVFVRQITDPSPGKDKYRPVPPLPCISTVPRRCD